MRYLEIVKSALESKELLGRYQYSIVIPCSDRIEDVQLIENALHFYGYTVVDHRGYWKAGMMRQYCITPFVPVHWIIVKMTRFNEKSRIGTDKKYYKSWDKAVDIAKEYTKSNPVGYVVLPCFGLTLQSLEKYEIVD